MNDAGLPEGANRKKRASLRGRHRHQDLKSSHTTRRPARNLRGAQQIQNQTQSKEVRIRRTGGEAAWLYGLCPRNRGKP